MHITYTKKFLGTPFIIETSTIKNSPGTWNSSKVSIYRDEHLIGEYIRNDSDRGIETFYPFTSNNDWYALYSANYAAIRVMKLHTDYIEDWCGETGTENGFYPAEFYIPRYHQIRDDDSDHLYVVDCDTKNDQEFQQCRLGTNYLSTEYSKFGFVVGSMWGDDGSRKLRYIDLAKIPNKELMITEKFGYWKLPEGVSLKECIHMKNWKPDHQWITLICATDTNLDTGARE